MDQLTLSPEERALLDATAVPLRDERRLQLADFVLTEIHEPPRRSRRTLGILAAVVAALTLTGGVTAYAWIARTEAPKDPYVVYCYNEATSADRGEGWIGATVTAVPDLDGENRPRLAAIASCTNAWDLGALHAPGTPRPAKDTGNPVPALTACVDNDGYAVVFPSNDPTTCTRLGIADLE